MPDTIWVRPTLDEAGEPTGEWYWSRVAPNERVVASNGGFNDKDNAEEAAAREAEGTDALIKVDDPGES